MNIVFICSSLEEGRDGVGDYAKLLALELSRLGHDVSLVSLNDKYIFKTTKGVISERNITLKFLRIPYTISSNQRYYLLSNWVYSEKPHLISIQYSGFGFQKYGLPWYIIRDFRKLGSKYPIHIMFHELWCGMALRANTKEKILGLSQALFIKIMTLFLKPRAVFTSIIPYVNSLKGIGIEAKTTPIFSTINLDSVGNDQDWELLKHQFNLYSLVNNPQQWLVISFFGTIYPCVGLDKLIKICSNVAVQSNKKFGVITFGTNRGLNAEIVLRGISFDECWNIGPLSVPMINRIIKLVDLGVVTSPVDGIDKSTTAKAWLERTVPVLISIDDKSYDLSEMKPIGIFQISTTSDVLEALNASKNIVNPNFLQKTSIAYEDLLTVNK